MVSWNFADLWETCARVRADQPAMTHGDRVISWSELNRRANSLASTMVEAGVEHQSKVAQYLYNGPGYLTSVFACFKAGLVPVNTNYRYSSDELVYLWDNADTEVIIFHGTFTPIVEAIADRLPGVKLGLWVDDGSGPCPAWASRYDEAVSTPPGGTETNALAPWGRSGTDLWLLYTGGTTGRPKGVMWEQDSLVRIMSRKSSLPINDSVTPTVYAAWVTSEPPVVALTAAPLMHGTGQLTAFRALLAGGTIVTMTERHFSAPSMLDECEARSVNAVAIVGDAFARPIVEALDAEPNRWDLGAMATMVSSGVMWSQPVKEGLIRHIPQLTIADTLASSEALGMGSSVSTRDGIRSTARFDLGVSGVVIADDGTLVKPGSGVTGRLGVSGLLPIGYYKDPDKSAATFPTINGRRYSLPGDYATIEADGTITLLGRGSVCINTGG